MQPDRLTLHEATSAQREHICQLHTRKRTLPCSGVCVWGCGEGEVEVSTGPLSWSLEVHTRSYMTKCWRVRDIQRGRLPNIWIAYESLLELRLGSEIRQARHSYKKHMYLRDVERGGARASAGKTRTKKKIYIYIYRSWWWPSPLWTACVPLEVTSAKMLKLFFEVLRESWNCVSYFGKERRLDTSIVGLNVFACSKTVCVVSPWNWSVVY